MGLYISHARGHASSKEIMCPGSAVHKQWDDKRDAARAMLAMRTTTKTAKRARLRTEIVNANGEIREDDI